MGNQTLSVVKSVFDKEENIKKFGQILNEDPTNFITTVLDVVKNNDLLASATPESILYASATSATLKLPLNPNLGFAYIVPYKKNFKDADGQWQSVTQAQFQLGYKGFQQLAHRTNKFRTLNVSKIVEGELKKTNYLTGEREFDFIEDQDERNSKKVIGYVAYFELLTGFRKSMYMTKKEVEKHGAKYSQSYSKKHSQWQKNFEVMAKKTVLKLLLSRHAPLSAEMQKAMVYDQAVINDWDGKDYQYIDKNEREKLEEVQKKKEEARIVAWIDSSDSLDKLTQVNDAVYASESEELIKLYEQKGMEFDISDPSA